MVKKLSAIFLLSLVCLGSSNAQDRPTREDFMLRHVDRDGDGFISRNEFVSIIGATNRQADAGRDHFNEADINSDNVVDLEELRQWLSKRN